MIRSDELIIGNSTGGVGLRLAGGRWLCFCPRYRRGKPDGYQANPESLPACRQCGATRPVPKPAAPAEVGAA